MATTSRTISYVMMDVVINLLQLLLVARPRVRPIACTMTYHQPIDRSQLLEIVANIADRSHVRQIATVRSGVTVALANCASHYLRQQGEASDLSRVEELSVGKILLTKKGGGLLVQVAHTGQDGSSTQPANFAKVKQIAVGPYWTSTSSTSAWNWR